MDIAKSPLERAFELASSGAVANVTELRARIKGEGYSTAQLVGPTLSRQLRQLIAQASANREA